MTCCWQWFGAALVYMIMILTVNQSDSREIRPSEHGLLCQDSPAPVTGESYTEMLSFFGGLDSNVSLPEARNMSNASADSDVIKKGGGRGHLTDVMLVISLTCGVSGVVLFIAAASVLVFRFRKKCRASSTSSPPQQQQPPLLMLEYKTTNINKD